MINPVNRILGKTVRDTYSHNKTVYWIIINAKGQVLSKTNLFLPKNEIDDNDVAVFDNPEAAIRVITRLFGNSKYVTTKRWIR